MKMDNPSIGFKERIVVTPASRVCQEDFSSGAPPRLPAKSLLTGWRACCLLAGQTYE